MPGATLPAKLLATASPAEIMAALRIRAGQHLPSLARALGYESMGAWADCHHELMAHVDRPSDGRKRLTLIPRGHLKTSLVTVCRILERLRERPELRILLASSTATLAQGILREIRGHLRSHPLFVDIAGEKGWQETAEAVTVARTRADRTPTIRAVGVGGVTVGEHYDMIVLDDVVTRETCSTKDQLDKLREWYRLLLPMAEPGAEIIIIGTRYHFADLYSDLLGEHEETRDMAEDVDAYVRRAIEAGEPIWPEKFSLETLASLKAQMGSYLFGTQYMNDPADPDSAVFKRDHLRWIADPTAVPPRSDCTRVTVTDWAMSEKTSADYTVIATVDVDRQNRKWVRKLTRGRWGPDRQAEAIDAACGHLAEMRPDRFAVQKATLDRAIGANLRTRAAELRLALPMIELSLSEASKFDRIIGLQPDFEEARLFFVEGCLDGLTAAELEDEITRFPKAPHDDILDALADVDRTAEGVPRAPVANLPRRSTKRRY